MTRSHDLPQLHQRARAAVSNNRLHCGGQFESSKDVMDVLRGLEDMRASVSDIISHGGADLAVDLLLCVVSEVRRIDLRRTSGSDREHDLFHLCQNDELIHDFIYRWLDDRDD